MTRKAIKRRNTPEEAEETLADYIASSAPPITLQDREHLRSSQSDRAAHLLAYKPKSEHPQVRALIELVVDLVLRVDFVSTGSDRNMMKIGFRYALYCVDTFGEFDPARHLVEANIQRWAVGLTVSKISRQSWVSALRRLRRGKRYEAKFSRYVAQPPYTDDEWAPLNRLRLSGVSEEATLLLTLSGELGLRPKEIHTITGNWIHFDGDRTWLTVPDDDGVVRMVPAFGLTAEWLRTQASAGGDYLLRPRRKWRHSVISEVAQGIAKRHHEFEGFRSDYGRHMYVLNLLRQRIPLRTIYSVAGLRPGSTLPGDLMAFLEDPSPESVYRNLAHAHEAEQQRAAERATRRGTVSRRPVTYERTRHGFTSATPR